MSCDLPMEDRDRWQTIGPDERAIGRHREDSRAQ
jgi:hypothetical protein